jgi:hypothetical protein
MLVMDALPRNFFQNHAKGVSFYLSVKAVIKPFKLQYSVFLIRDSLALQSSLTPTNLCKLFFLSKTVIVNNFKQI